MHKSITDLNIDWIATNESYKINCEKVVLCSGILTRKGMFGKTTATTLPRYSYFTPT